MHIRARSRYRWVVGICTIVGQPRFPCPGMTVIGRIHIVHLEIPITVLFKGNMDHTVGDSNTGNIREIVVFGQSRFGAPRTTFIC